jgi:hypothetical protein
MPLSTSRTTSTPSSAATSTVSRSRSTPGGTSGRRQAADDLQDDDLAACAADRRDSLRGFRDVGKRPADSGAGHADVIVDPTCWTAWHGRLPAMIDATDAGFLTAEQGGLPPVGLCVSHLRLQSPDAAAQRVEMPVSLCHPHVVVLSIDGTEAAAGRSGSRNAQALPARWRGRSPRASTTVCGRSRASFAARRSAGPMMFLATWRATRSKRASPRRTSRRS